MNHFTVDEIQSDVLITDTWEIFNSPGRYLLHQFLRPVEQNLSV